MREESSHLTQLSVRPRIPLAAIDAIVAANLGPARVPGNAQPNAMYRHIAMYLCKHVGGWSTTRIGKFYNGRDHSTVSYAIRRIESRRLRDPEFDALLRTLTEMCNQSEVKEPHAFAVNTSSTRIICFDSLLMSELIDCVTERVLARLELRALPTGTREHSDVPDAFS
jgi:hypothetical protein